jgi:arylsulfatase
MEHSITKTIWIFILSIALFSELHAQKSKPNILIIWGDDIGISNISHNNGGMIGYKTPNIDRIERYSK